MIGPYLVIIGMLMIISGFLLVFAAGFYGARRSESSEEYPFEPASREYGAPSRNMGQEPIQGKTKVKGGGIIMLGPIPIIIGSDGKNALILAILAIVLMVLYFLIFM